MDSAPNESIAERMLPLVARPERIPSEAVRHSESPTPAIDDEIAWRKLLNRLFIYEEDQLFKWAKTVRTAVCGEGGKPTKPEQGAA